MDVTEMIERGARALASRRGEDADQRWTSHAEDVRAVIAALREPTAAMVQAGAMAEIAENWLSVEGAEIIPRKSPIGLALADAGCIDIDAGIAAMWRAMNDAALLPESEAISAQRPNRG